MKMIASFNISLTTGVLCLFSVVAYAIEVRPQDQKQGRMVALKEATQLVATKTALPVYRPPSRGMPLARVGCGTRGTGDSLPTLYILAPDHVGLTSQEYPVLSWHLSKSTPTRFEFSLVNDMKIEPILELSLDVTKKGGMYQLNLEDYGIKLKPGVQYQWSIALVPNMAKRSSDVIASGMIERSKASSDLLSRLQSVDGLEKSFIYAEEGYWYDALSELDVLFRKQPDNEALKQQRASLLQQVGLPELGISR